MASKKQDCYKCKKCGDEIFWNTRKRYVQCSCGALAVDGCEDYVRVIGDAGNYKLIRKTSGEHG